MHEQESLVSTIGMKVEQSTDKQQMSQMMIHVYRLCSRYMPMVPDFTIIENNYYKQKL